jgi:hypothetical protein
MPRSKNAWRYTATPSIRLHDVVLSLKEAQGQLYLLPYRILVGKFQGKWPLRGTKPLLEYNIRIDLKEIRCGGVDWV